MTQSAAAAPTTRACTEPPRAAPHRLIIRNAADLVEGVPHLVGFHPQDSVVAVTLVGPRRRVGPVLRADLSHARAGDWCGPGLARFAAEHGADAVLVVVFGSTPPSADGLPEKSLIPALAEALGVAGVALVDALYVTADRWWSYVCVEPNCCPPGGTPRSAPASDGFASAAARAGLTALPNRAALAATLDPIAGPAAATLERAVQRAEEASIEAVAAAGSISRWRAGAKRHIRQLKAAAPRTPNLGQEPDMWLADEDAAQALVSLGDTPIRDYCWYQIERGPSERWLSLWYPLARLAPRSHASDPCFLLGWTAWRRGEGALARIAAERALAAASGYTAAQLLIEILDRGVDPRLFPSLSGVRARRQRSRRSGS
jgi:Domain of unknown function (DUF4192)